MEYSALAVINLINNELCLLFMELTIYTVASYVHKFAIFGWWLSRWLQFYDLGVQLRLEVAKGDCSSESISEPWSRDTQARNNWQDKAAIYRFFNQHNPTMINILSKYFTTFTSIRSSHQQYAQINEKKCAISFSDLIVIACSNYQSSYHKIPRVNKFDYHDNNLLN